MLVTLFCPRQFHSMRSAHKPAIHHGVRDFRMKLQRIAGVVSEGLNGEGISFGEQFAAGRQVETFAMPLIHVVRPLGAHLPSRFGRTNWVIPDFGVSLRMRIHTGTEM